MIKSYLQLVVNINFSLESFTALSGHFSSIWETYHIWSFFKSIWRQPMNINERAKYKALGNINEVAEILAAAFIRLQEKSALTDDSRDNLVDLAATPSIHAAHNKTLNTEV
jgi:hypothetical protein